MLMIEPEALKLSKALSLRVVVGKPTNEQQIIDLLHQLVTSTLANTKRPNASRINQ